MYNRLKQGASYYACGAFLNTLGAMRRASIYTSLGYERLQRKNQDILNILEQNLKAWPQTFYTMLLRTLGGMDNKEAFTTLAKKVPYSIILRERKNPKNIEALYIGTSGLLELYKHDEYILNLKRDYHYLSTKYEIEPMRTSDWKLRNIYPNNHPILRLSQLTTFFEHTNNIMDHILNCKTPEHVYNLFSSETQPYWRTHYTPANTSPTVTKRMGRTKTDLIAINLVVQMQFAYGSYINSEELHSRALTLLEKIPAEQNSIIKQWNSYGPLAKSAFDSQALLQLSFEYCRNKRCEECPVARWIKMEEEKAKNRQDQTP